MSRMSIANPGGSSVSDPSWRISDLDPAFVSAAVMDDDPLVGVDDQVVPHARQREIARELDAPVDSPARRRDDLDHDDRVHDLDRVARQGRSAPDQRVGLVDGPVVDPDRHAIGHDPAREASRADGAAKRDRRVELGLVVARPLGSHRDDDAVVELEAARSAAPAPRR